jgi:hypothetical protein
VRAELKATFPLCKFSVTADGHSISVSLMEAPYQVLAEGNGYAQLNPYYIDSAHEHNYMNNGSTLTHVGWEVVAKATEIANRQNWDKSDIQSDYFNCNYYLHINIGKWDRPFIVTQ